MLSPEVQRVLDSAAVEARRRGNPIVTLEHVVYALAGDPEARALLSALGAKLGPLRADLARHLDELPTTSSLDLTTAITREVHDHGIGSAGRYSLREARLLVERATALARGADYPLQLSIQRVS